MLKGRNRKAGAEIRTFDCAFTGLRGLLPGIWRFAGSKLFRNPNRIAPPAVASGSSWARTCDHALQAATPEPCNGINQTCSFLAQVGA